MRKQRFFHSFLLANSTKKGNGFFLVLKKKRTYGFSYQTEQSFLSLSFAKNSTRPLSSCQFLNFHARFEMLLSA